MAFCRFGRFLPPLASACGDFFILSAADIKRTIKFNSLHKNIIVQKQKLLIAHIQLEM